MSPGSGPRFDESLASAARGLHVAELAAAAFVVAAVLFWVLERRGRRRWEEVPTVMLCTARAPYRSSAIISGHLRAAPWLVRAASFASLAGGLLFAPLIVLALVKYPFDGIAIPLVPGLALQVLNWSCSWLFLARSPLAVATARSGAVGALMANVGLMGIAGAHFVVVELQRRDGIEHACSSSVTFVVIVFAVASVLQSLFTMAALRRHERVLEWTAGRRLSASDAVEREGLQGADVDGLGESEGLRVARGGHEAKMHEVAAGDEEGDLAKSPYAVPALRGRVSMDGGGAGDDLGVGWDAGARVERGGGS
jgi:hypothetical protein